MADSCDQSGPSRAERLIELGALRMSSAREGAVHTICLFGELDLGTTGRVDAELQCVEATDARMIVVDLAGLTFIGSTGVHLLVDGEVRSRADSRRLTLLRGSPAVQRVLEICGVGAALPFANQSSASRTDPVNEGASRHFTFGRDEAMLGPSTG